MGRPNGAARARCRETNVQEAEILSALEMKAKCRDRNRTGPAGPSPTAGSSFRVQSLDPVTAARPSFLQAARLSAVAIRVFTIWWFEKKKRKKERVAQTDVRCNKDCNS